MWMILQRSLSKEIIHKIRCHNMVRWGFSDSVMKTVNLLGDVRDPNATLSLKYVPNRQTGSHYRPLSSFFIISSRKIAPCTLLHCRIPRFHFNPTIEADTTGAICGQLAGALYGWPGKLSWIVEWRSIKGMMGHCLVVLQHNLSSTGGKGIVGQRQPRKCMTRQVQCAEQQDSHSNFTKYCACHACAFLSLHLGQLTWRAGNKKVNSTFSSSICPKFLPARRQQVALDGVEDNI